MVWNILEAGFSEIVVTELDSAFFNYVVVEQCAKKQADESSRQTHFDYAQRPKHGLPSSDELYLEFQRAFAIHFQSNIIKS